MSKQWELFKKGIQSMFKNPSPPPLNPLCTSANFIFPFPSSPSSPSKSLSYISKVNTHHHKYGDGWITKGVMKDNKTMVCVDHLTYSVKTINVDSDEVIHCLTLPERPWSITRVEPEQVVVTSNDKLIFIKVGETLSVVKEVNISYDCSGIVYTNNTLIVSVLNPGSVKVLDLDGDILKVISTDAEGQEMFVYPQDIALSPDQKTLYVADIGKHSVTRMDRNGTIQHVYKPDGLRCPSSLVVDIEGFIYIAGREHYNMHIISPTCKAVKSFNVATLGINSPFTVTVCTVKNKLYISYFDKSTDIPVNIVSVYKISYE